MVFLAPLLLATIVGFIAPANPVETMVLASPIRLFALVSIAKGLAIKLACSSSLETPVASDIARLWYSQRHYRLLVSLTHAALATFAKGLPAKLLAHCDGTVSAMPLWQSI